MFGGYVYLFMSFTVLYTKTFNIFLKRVAFFNLKVYFSIYEPYWSITNLSLYKTINCLFPVSHKLFHIFCWISVW